MFRSSRKINPAKKQKQQKREKEEKALRFQESERLKAAERRVQQERKTTLSNLFRPGKLYSLTETKWASIAHRKFLILRGCIVFFLGVGFGEKVCFLRVLFGEEILEFKFSLKESIETISRFLKPVDTTFVLA